MTITQSQNARLHQLLNKTGLIKQKANLVAGFTAGRTEHSSEMNVDEAQGLIAYLNAQSFNAKDGGVLTENRLLDKKRKAIIAQFRSIGKSANDAIAWVESREWKGKRAKINDFSAQELHVILTAAKKMKSDFEKAIRKQL